MIPAKGKVLLSVLIYQNETVSKSAESGKIEQRVRDRVERARGETQRILFKRERLTRKA
jgi:hypothetical protein